MVVCGPSGLTTGSASLRNRYLVEGFLIGGCEIANRKYPELDGFREVISRYEVCAARVPISDLCFPIPWPKCERSFVRTG